MTEPEDNAPGFAMGVVMLLVMTVGSLAVIGGALWLIGRLVGHLVGGLV